MAATPGYVKNNALGTYTASGSCVLAFPTDVSANYICITQVVITDANPTVTWPTGFNQIISLSEGGSFHAAVAWKRMDGSESSTTSAVTFSLASTGSIRSSFYSGVLIVDNPIEASAALQGTSTNVSGAAFTTLGNNRLGLGLSFYRRNVGTTPPAGWTEQQDAGGLPHYTLDVLGIASPTTMPVVTRGPITSSEWITLRMALLPNDSKARNFCVMV